MSTENQKSWSELMVLSQAGDQNAYQQLLTEISVAITKRVRRFISKSSDVEDIHQEALLSIHKARHTYDPKYPFEPWFYTIVRNTIYDFLRKHQRKFSKEVFVAEFYDEAPRDTEHEEKELFKNVMQKLPDSQREAVELIKIKGLSIKEAAQEAGISVAAMKVRAHRGYETLKKEILSDDVEESK